MIEIIIGIVVATAIVTAGVVTAEAQKQNTNRTRMWLDAIRNAYHDGARRGFIE